MNPDRTIADAAEQALREIGRPAPLEEIYGWIVGKALYEFNTPTPEHVLYTTLQRHLEDSKRIDASVEVRFRIDAVQHYSLTTKMSTASPQTKSRGPRRIMRSSDKEDLVQELMSERIGVFREIWRLLLFAAQIGFKEGSREPLSSTDPGKGIDQSTFGNSGSWPGILYLAALVDGGDTDLLSSNPDSDDRRISLFQEYANGGLSIIHDFFKERAIDFDGLLALIERYQSVATAVVGRADLDLTI